MDYLNKTRMVAPVASQPQRITGQTISRPYDMAPDDFRRVTSSWQPEDAVDMAQRWGMNSGQVVDLWNNAYGTDYTRDQAASMLGAPNVGHTFGRAYQTQDPRTGSFSIDPTSPENFDDSNLGTPYSIYNQNDSAPPLPEGHLGYYAQPGGRINGANQNDFMAPEPRGSINPVNINPPGGGANTPGATLPGNTFTTPSESVSGAEGYMRSLMGMIPEYKTAYQNAAQLPGQIDAWTQDQLARQRLTADQATAMLQKVAGARAGTGIMGGTEEENLRSNVMNEYMKTLTNNQNNIMNQANSMKANVIAQLPGQALNAVNSGIGMYGNISSDKLNWAQIAASILNSSY